MEDWLSQVSQATMPRSLAHLMLDENHEPPTGLANDIKGDEMVATLKCIGILLLVAGLIIVALRSMGKIGEEVEVGQVWVYKNDFDDDDPFTMHMPEILEVVEVRGKWAQCKVLSHGFLEPGQLISRRISSLRMLYERR